MFACFVTHVDSVFLQEQRKFGVSGGTLKLKSKVGCVFVLPCMYCLFLFIFVLHIYFVFIIFGVRLQYDLSFSSDVITCKRNLCVCVFSFHV